MNFRREALLLVAALVAFALLTPSLQPRAATDAGSALRGTSHLAFEPANPPDWLLRVEQPPYPAGHEDFLDGVESSSCGTSPERSAYLWERYQLARYLANLGAVEEEIASSESDQVRNRDGVYVIESDSTILFHDNPGDLEGRSLHFVPLGGGGYSVTMEDSLYETGIGTPVLSNAAAPTFIQIDLANFSFPLGGSSHGTLWAGTDLSVRADDGSAMPGISGDQYGKHTGAIGIDLLLDRAPRLSPLFHALRGFSGRWIWVSDTSERLLITWRQWGDPTDQFFHLDLQAALYPNGEIIFSYETVRNTDNGAPLVYADVQGWLAGFSSVAAGTDPLDGFNPAVDITAFAADEDPESEMLRLRTTFAAPLPETNPDRLRYYARILQGGVPRYDFWMRIDNSGRSDLLVQVKSTGAWLLIGKSVVDGSTWDILIGVTDLPELSPGPVTFQPFTYEVDTLRDSLSASGAISGGASFVRDYTVESPFVSTRPVVEPFLLPELLPHGVKDKLLAHTGWDETLIDGLPIYQTFLTDMYFRGHYGEYLGGNCGAANIGVCDPGAALAPGLLNMNRTEFGRNDPESLQRFRVLSHEFSHHWLEKIRIDEGSGPSDVLNPQSHHPAAYVHTEALRDILYPEDSSMLGGGYWISNGDGSWTSYSQDTYWSFTEYELYLMGLMAPAEVSAWFYLADTDPPQPLEYWPEPDTTVTGDYHPVTMQMVVDAMGTRDPVYPATRQDFFAPLVLLVRPGEEPSAEAWDFMMSVRHPWRSMFHDQTGSRGTVTTVSPREVSPTGAAPLRIEKQPGNVLRFYFEDPDFEGQVKYNLYEGTLGGGYDNWAPKLCGQVPAPTGSELYLDATPLAGDRYFLVTMSNLVFEGDAGKASNDGERTTHGTRCGGQP